MSYFQANKSRRKSNERSRSHKVDHFHQRQASQECIPRRGAPNQVISGNFNRPPARPRQPQPVMVNSHSNQNIRTSGRSSSASVRIQYPAPVRSMSKNPMVNGNTSTSLGPRGQQLIQKPGDTYQSINSTRAGSNSIAAHDNNYASSMINIANPHKFTNIPDSLADLDQSYPVNHKRVSSKADSKPTSMQEIEDIQMHNLHYRSRDMEKRPSFAMERVITNGVRNRSSTPNGPITGTPGRRRHTIQEQTRPVIPTSTQNGRSGTPIKRSQTMQEPDQYNNNKKSKSNINFIREANNSRNVGSDQQINEGTPFVIANYAQKMGSNSEIPNNISQHYNMPLQ